MRISSPHKHNFSHHSHKHHKFLKMTNTRTFNINTIWGHVNTTTSTLHLYPKLHKCTKTYLFDLLPQNILTEIYFLASRLEHRNKIKAIITKVNPLFNSIIFSILQELWVPYHIVSKRFARRICN